MKHSEVVAALSEQLEISKPEVSKLLDHFSNVFRKLLDNETTLTLPNLGTFKTIERGKRKGYDPGRKQHMILPPKRLLSYHPNSTLRVEMKERERTQ
ncbi:HU family DNA-binding protein [candidate division KSB1 bacterium]|nr:HU family DNA-binding protein [candidate division KSB1 bacterium]